MKPDEMTNEELAREIVRLASEFTEKVMELARMKDRAMAEGRFDDAAQIDALLVDMERKARELGIIPPDPFAVKT